MQENTPQKTTERKIWFYRKRYGWGWGLPASWEGWAVLSFYIGFIVATFRAIDLEQHSGSDTLINFVPRFIIATIILIAICYWKGEKPKWSWGGDK